MPRLLLALLSMGLATWLGWTLLQSSRRSSDPLDLVDSTQEYDRILEQREGSVASWVLGGPLDLELLDEPTARALFVMHAEDLIYDPEIYYRYRPGIRTRVEWPEHPRGEWWRVTNSRGLRESSDEQFGAQDLRILVAGDSHTDGVCDNEESFANQLEARLSEEQSTIVLNTGVAGFSFYNYLGALDEALAGEHGEAPHVFIVAVYGGNDFLEVLRPHHFFRGTRMPPQRPGYWARIEAAKRVSTAALGQGLNQLAYFLEQPDQLEVSLEACRAVMGELARRCAERDVRFMVTYIPAAFYAPWPELEPGLQRALAALELEESALEVGLELQAGLEQVLAELGVQYLDMTPVFAASEELAYWERDLHISVVGQRLVAEQLEAALRDEVGTGALLAPREAPSDGAYREEFADGTTKVEGRFVAGARSGTWKRYHSGGSPRSEGRYEAGLRAGPWSFWYADGQLLKQGEYEDNQPQGPWREWYPDGVLRREGPWEAGLPQGLWKEWHPDGSLASEGHYAQGEYDGEWRNFYPGGYPQTSTQWEQGTKRGPVVSWHKPGEGESQGPKRFEGTFHADRPSGTWTYYYPSGERRSQGVFRRGKREGPSFFWTENGDLDDERSGVYRAGIRQRGLDESERSGAPE